MKMSVLVINMDPKMPIMVILRKADSVENWASVQLMGLSESGIICGVGIVIP